MLIIFAVSYLIWRVGRTDYYAPLVVVVQIITASFARPRHPGQCFPSTTRSFHPRGGAIAQRHRLVLSVRVDLCGSRVSSSI